MRLMARMVPTWPKLAWVASSREGSTDIQVQHGKMVEAAEPWIVEAVWAGDFDQGDFDRTDLVFGSGVRLRGDHAVFVSPATVFDRLLYVLHDGRWHFSNSLPALLAVANMELRIDYTDYSRDARSITRGLERRVRTVPTTSTDITSIYFNNILFDGHSVCEEAKVDTAPAFSKYEDYHAYLVATAKSLGANARSAARRHPVHLLASISSGYDSCATATISRHAGCNDTVSIVQSSSLWRGSDSGAHVARALGMSCREYPRTAAVYPLEEAVWAAEGRPGVMNWTLFDYPEPLCLFFTGCHGEKLWDRVNHDHPDPFVRRDPSSLGFCEYRLFRGVFQCPMPFWAVRHSHELQAITATEAMRPWYMERDHDKPIARRIVEEAGVPRRAFGTLNKNTSLETPFPWPHSPRARGRFRRYLARHDRFAPSDFTVRALGTLARLDTLLYRNTVKRLGVRRGTPAWRRYAGRLPLFQWANSELAARYSNALANTPDSPRADVT